MKNRQFFKWVYDRMVIIHEEDERYDYMINFKHLLDEPIDYIYHAKILHEMVKCGASKYDTAKYIAVNFFDDNGSFARKGEN